MKRKKEIKKKEGDESILFTEMSQIDDGSGNITNKEISNAQIKEDWRTSCRRWKKIAKSIKYICQVKYIIPTEYQCDTLSQRSQICMWNSKINDRCHDCICLILYRNRLRYNPHNGSICDVASASCSRIKNKNWTFRETSRHLQEEFCILTLLEELKLSWLRNYI